MSVCIWLLESTMLDLPASEDPWSSMGAQDQGRGIGERRCAGTSGMVLNLESVKCVLSLVAFCLYQMERRKGTCLSTLSFMSVLYVGAVKSSVLLCSWPCQCPCVCLSALLLVEPANETAATMSIVLGWRSLGLWGGLQGPTEWITGPKRCWRWWPPVKSLNKMQSEYL